MHTPHYNHMIASIVSLIVVLTLLVGSQIFWISRLRDLGRRLIRSQAARCWAATALAAYAALWVYEIASFFLTRTRSATDASARVILIDGPLSWWLFGSIIGFLIVFILRLPDYLFRGIRGLCRKVILRLAPATAARTEIEPAWMSHQVGCSGGRAGFEPRRKELPTSKFPSRTARFAAHEPLSAGGREKAGTSAYGAVEALPSCDPCETFRRVTSRRQFVRTTTTALGTLPFAGGFYGMLFGRVHLEVTRRRVRLERLPRGFEGFRIVQLSDIHIGPFMTRAEIRRVVGVAQRLRGDLIALSGDYISWDPTTQGAVVEALSGLRAPYGILGCLGNHEAWTGVEDSIARLFRVQGIRILRHQSAIVRAGGDELNVIGVDFQTHRPALARHKGIVRQYLAGVERLVRKNTANILLSHNPNTFDRAAELAIDLSLAGHTHGGQVALEFISPQLAPTRLITPYVAGWFGKPGGQLYVNRGIGTIGPPIRWGAPPEITLFELTRTG